MGFSRQEYWSGLPCPPPGGLPHPRMESASLTSPALAGRFFITSATWEARNIYKENRIMKTIFMSLVDVRVCLPEFTRGGSCSLIHLLQYHKIGLITIQPCYYKNSYNNTMHSIYKPVENSIPRIQCISKLKTVGKLKLNWCLFIIRIYSRKLKQLVLTLFPDDERSETNSLRTFKEYDHLG